MAIVPRPGNAPRRTGAFVAGEDVRIRVIGEADAAAELLRHYIQARTGRMLGESPEGMLMLAHDPALRGLGPEGYALLVSPDAVMLRAGTHAGLRHGVQSFRQLLTADGRMPAMDVQDSPAFAWRGVTLDVADRFASVAELRAFIDEMASYKLNVLHLRLPADAFPALGSGYSKADLRDLVEFAAQRGVTVVPGVTLPGPAKDVEFGRTVLAEMMEVFPSPWVHLGGEAPGLLLGRLADEVAARGRTPVCWYDGGALESIPTQAVVMARRGLGDALKAAHRGHRVVLACDDPLPAGWPKGHSALVLGLHGHDRPDLRAIAEASWSGRGAANPQARRRVTSSTSVPSSASARTVIAAGVSFVAGVTPTATRP